MKLTVNVKLKPTKEQFKALKTTLERCNAACNFASAQAWRLETFGQFNLHKAVYYAIRETFELSAQAAVRCVSKVADAYKKDKKTQRTFRKHAAQPFDDRLFRFVDDNWLSIWTLSGREKIEYAASRNQREMLKQRKGEVDLMLIRGDFYIGVVVDIDDTQLIDPKGALGVDLGIKALAVDSKGNRYSGDAIDEKRRIYAHRRRNLQRNGSRSAKRKLRTLKGRQARFQKHENHSISKRLVAEAKRSGLSIALEDLNGIRDRVKARKSQRQRLSNWGFHQLRSFIEYKAKLAGVPVYAVDPRNSSRECSACGHIDKRNRKNRDDFVCVSCNYTIDADFNAALNLSARGEKVSRPNGSRKAVKVSSCQHRCSAQI